MTNTTCAHCGKPFHAVRSTATFCSVRCRVAAHRTDDPKGKEQYGYYCYTHATPDGEVFYVGKGRKGRAWDFDSRSDEHKEIVSRFGPENIKVEIFPAVTEEEALHLERFVINVCFDRDGLVNKTSGGEGAGYAKTNAEFQAEWRHRRKSELEGLRRENETLRKTIEGMGAPAQSRPSPFADCTPDELAMLVAALKHHRDTKAAGENPPEDAAKTDHREEQIRRQQEREALKEKSRPVAGVTYWVRGTNTETLAGLVMPTTIVKGRADFGTYTEALKFAKGVWMTKSDRTLYASKQDALAALFDSPRWNPLTAIPEKDLRKLWSYHHPDRFNADGDQTIFQAAVEELDRRRASNNS